MANRDIEKHRYQAQTDYQNNNNNYTNNYQQQQQQQQQQAYYVTSKRQYTSWLVPMIVVANIAVFIVVMVVNNCPKTYFGFDGCFAKFLGRLSFQPVRENPLLGPSSATLLKMGALQWDKVVHQHQAWRLFTCFWLHGGVFHLLANMVSLVFIGIRLEQEFGFGMIRGEQILVRTEKLDRTGLFGPDRTRTDDFSVRSSVHVFPSIWSLVHLVRVLNWTKSIWSGFGPDHEVFGPVLGPHKKNIWSSVRSGSVRFDPVLDRCSALVRIGVLYLVSGLGGAILSVLFLQRNVSVGASGALFGLLGAMLSDLITNWTTYSGKAGALFTLLFMIAVDLAIGLLPIIDNFAHIGGFVTGFLLGFILLLQPQYGWVERHQLAEHARVKTKYLAYQKVLFVLAVLLLIAGFAVGLVMIFQGKNGNDHCTWCHYVDCVPTSRWVCGN